MLFFLKEDKLIMIINKQKITIQNIIFLTFRKKNKRLILFD